MNRRKFNLLGGLGVGGMLFPITALALGAKPRMALQLTTFHDLIKEDLAKAIDIAAYIGFVAVEAVPWPEGVSFEKGVKEIDKSGMEVCSVHVELPTQENISQLLEVADAYRCKKMIWNGWPKDPRFSSLDGVLELASIYNDANALFKENGLEFALHNHWWEFQPLPDGQLPFQILRDNLNTDILFEVDAYWIEVAGQDSGEIISSLGDRAPFLQIKDGPASYSPELETEGPETMVAVGDGSMDIPKIADAGDGFTKWMIVELENCETDVAEAVFDSYLYMRKNKLAKGMI